MRGLHSLEERGKRGGGQGRVKGAFHFTERQSISQESHNQRHKVHLSRDRPIKREEEGGRASERLMGGGTA